MRKLLLVLFTIMALAEIKAQLSSVHYIIDEDRSITLDSLLFGNYKEAFKDIDPQGLNFGFLDAGLWLKVKLDLDKLGRSEKTLVEFKNPNLDIVQVSYLVGREIYRLDPGGDQFPYAHRSIDHRYYQFLLDHSPHRIKTVYVYIDNIGDQLYVPLEVTSEISTSHRDYFLQYFNGIYFGILLFVLLLNTFMYFSLRERANLYYVLYILGLILLQLSLEGYGFEYLWPESTYMANHANPIFATFSVLFLLHFCREFLSLPEQMPKMDKAFKIVGYFLILVLLLALPNMRWTYQFSIVSINATAFLENIIIIPIGIYLWKNKYKAARFFVSAFVVLVIGVFFFILRNFGLIPNSLLTEKSLQIGSSFEVILLSLAIVDKFRIFKDQAYDRLQEINVMKSQANVVLERQVNERTSELRQQKEIVEVKNKEITESIEYAKRIQTGLLPSDKLFQSLMEGAFVLYKPKDIVSGDFYWIDAVDGRIYFAAVDCTGHGVPGAMVSVLGFNHLNRCINEHGLRKPSDILDKLTELIVGSFNKSELTIYDGMDIALCAYDPKTRKLEYAGANNPLYLIRKGELEEIKPTKKPIGYSEKDDKFVNHSFDLSEGDWIYVFSDGYADQFGGPKNKKFKYRELKNLLLEIVVKAPDEQCSILDQTFEDWKGRNEQLDDVCLIGKRVS